MTKEASTPSEILAGWREVTAFQGLPTSEALFQLEKELQDNATSVQTILGGGRLGHLGLVKDPLVYNLIAPNMPLLKPPQPPPAPIILNGMDENQQATAKLQYDSHQYIYDLYCNTEEALHHQIIKAIPEIYICNLQNIHTGYSQVTLLEFLQHLNNNYACVSKQDLQDNDKHFDEPINLDGPIDAVWNLVQEVEKYAHHAGVPYSPEKILNKMQLMFQKSGVFKKALDNFDALPCIQQTYPRFQANMNKGWQTYQDKIRLGTAQQGYHAAHQTMALQATMTEMINQVHIMQDQHQQALEAHALKACTPAPMPANDITLLTQLLSKLVNQSTPSLAPDPASQCKNFKYYCHTHGYGTNHMHTSRMCTNKETNHDVMATADDPKGGNFKNQSKYCKNE